MPAKLHPADAAAGRIIGRASRFEIALFRGQGRYAKAVAATLIEARKAATRLEAEVANGRTAMIYAITTEGRSALVTPATLQAMETNPMQQTYSTKFNARRAAEKAGTPADRIEVIKTPEGYSWRETPGVSAAPEAITAVEPASPAKGTKVKRDRAPRTPVASVVAAKPRQRANFEALEAGARTGKLPEPPDFSAATHARFRGKLARLADLAVAGDIDALRAFEINPVSSSPKAMARYRDLCVIALEVRAG
jgi:hypothetical protein